MKYRIKIVTYANGRKEYFAQYKTKIKWVGICYDGSTDLLMDFASVSRDNALERIDKHYGGNTRKQLIEFEYIDKP